MSEDRRYLREAGQGLEEQLPRSSRRRGFRGANTGQELVGRSGVSFLTVQEKRRSF